MDAVSAFPEGTNHATHLNSFMSVLLRFCGKNKFFLFKNFPLHPISTCSLEAKGLNNDLSLSLKIEMGTMPYVSKVAKVFLNNNASEAMVPCKLQAVFEDT